MTEEVIEREVVDIDLKDPQYYINRELSLLEFQRRVLQEAQDDKNPLLERIKFVAILSCVASWARTQAHPVRKPSARASGLTARSSARATPPASLA